MVVQAAVPSVGDLAQAITEQLRQYFHHRQDDADQIGGDYAQFVDHLCHFILDGGKRLRPIFAYWGWRSVCDDSPSEEIMLVFASLEILHAGALIHDDVIDCSDLRRGHPCIHRMFATDHQRHHWNGSADQFGISAAILLGDLSLVWADDIIHAACLDRATQHRIRLLWRQIRTEVLAGQYLDILAEATQAESIDSAMRVNMYKTASYTVIRPLQLGLGIAGEYPALSQMFEQIGQDIGIAFQLRDDVLGIFGDPALTGKQRGEDLRAGKRTVLIAEALCRAQQTNPDLAKQLRQAMGARLSDEDIAQLSQIIIDTGALEAVEERIGQLTTHAVKIIEQAPIHPSAQHGLIELASRLTDRRC